MAKIKLKQTSGEHQDCTSWCGVVVNGVVTIGELLDFAMKEDRFGDISILTESRAPFGNLVAEFDSGSFNFKGNAFRSLIVTGGRANGGWGRMSYIVEVKHENKK